MSYDVIFFCSCLVFSHPGSESLQYTLKPTTRVRRPTKKIQTKGTARTMYMSFPLVFVQVLPHVGNSKTFMEFCVPSRAKKEETVILYFPVNHCKYFKLRVQLLDLIVTSTVAVADNFFSVVCSQLGDVHISPVTYFLQHFVHYFLFSHPWDNYFAILDKNIAKFFSLYSIQFRHKELKPVKT